MVNSLTAIIWRFRDEM